MHMHTGRGVYAIPPTPFHNDGTIDIPSLERCVDFCLDAGVHGIVGPVVASEAAVLLDDERERVAEVLVERTAQRVPVVIGVSAASDVAAVRFARHAARIGADGVIAMPSPGASGADSVLRFYDQVASVAGGLPVWIQHYPGPGGTMMSSELLARVLLEVEGVSWLKEETAHAPQVMTKVRELAGDALHGVMGGMGGRYLIDEYARGACGTMPACEFADGHVAVWNALETGDHEAAVEMHTRLLPLINFEAMYGFAVWKSVLVRRGVIASARTRTPGAAKLDAGSERELERLLATVDDLLTLT